MKINKEQLRSINELNLSGIIDEMNDHQFTMYCKSLDTFVENFPNQEEKLKTFFKAKDYISFSKTLLVVKESLLQIYAKDLAQNCVKLINDVSTKRPEVVEAYFTYLLTTISMLSIDIQMKQHKDIAKGIGEHNESAEAAGGEEDRQKSVLAVDDVSLLLNGLKSALQNTTYKFIGITSGAAALKYIKNHNPDLFLLDIEMPEMNGYELAKRIKESGQKAPIVFLTGNSKKEYVLKAIQVGAVDFIVKPINKEQVLNKIKQYIG